MTRLPKEDLGLGDPPERFWIYIGQDEQGSGSCWYTLDHTTQAASPPRINIMERRLRGYITGLRMRETVWRNQPKWKLEIFIDGDRQYAIRAGLDTTFSRGIIMALASIASPEELKGALYIVVKPADRNQKSVFGSVYLESGEKVKSEWDNKEPLVPIVNNLQLVLGDGGQSESPSDNDHHVSDAARDQYEDPQRDERPTAANGERMSTAAQHTELLRVAGLLSWSREELDGDCAARYQGLPINELTFVEAVEYRQTLLAAVKNL